MELRLTPRDRAPICVVCRDDGPAVACACGAVYHDDCRWELGRCATNGCASTAGQAVGARRPGRWWSRIGPTARRAAIAAAASAALAVPLKLRLHDVPFGRALVVLAVTGAVLSVGAQHDVVLWED
jgi:hypothetical protein